MLALTICQPFAELIARGEKRVENRTWWPPRGMIGQRVAIHAGKSRQWLRGYPAEGLVFGAVIATARLAGVWSLDEIESGQCADEFRGLPPAWLRDHEHTEGPVCWVLDNVQRLPEPVAISGALGLWQVRGTLPEVVEGVSPIAPTLPAVADLVRERARWLF